MAHGTFAATRKTPVVVATGFTTAFLGDERTLREFIVGDFVRNRITAAGENAILYLINDSYDPLNYRQLRIGVNKDESLLEQFEGFCGRPISEIPDPFGCHESYSAHFAHAHLKRLHALDIHPVVLDVYQAYRKGYYADYILATLENYDGIQQTLAEKFSQYEIKNLFRVQCPKCRYMDAAQIKTVQDGIVAFECGRCRETMRQSAAEIQGKLAWKLDCAARWNLYNVDVETFSKAHTTELGSFEISSFISRSFFGGKVPDIERYGDVKISPDLSYQLLQAVPPQIVKALFSSHQTRDLEIDGEYVENFCSRFYVQPGLSYIDYVRTVLPRHALGGAIRRRPSRSGRQAAADADIDDESLVAYGNRFSKLWYGKEYRIRYPDIVTIASADADTLQTVNRLIRFVVSVRSGAIPETTDVVAMIKAYLSDQKRSPRLYPFLRRLFCQLEGPSISTLLAVLPEDYLTTVQTMLSCAAGEVAAAPSAPEAGREGGGDAPQPNPDALEWPVIRQVNRIA